MNRLQRFNQSAEDKPWAQRSKIEESECATADNGYRKAPLIFVPTCQFQTLIPGISQHSDSQTCKSLYELAFTKTTWLALVVDLRRRLILDAARTPDLQDLTTEELIAIVKRLKTGPSSWGAGGAPHISKEIIVQVKMRRGGYHHAKLLRSGGHVLFHNYGALECWDVARDHLVWGYTPLVEGGEVICFAAEENGGGERLTHDDLLVTRSPPPTPFLAPVPHPFLVLFALYSRRQWANIDLVPEHMIVSMDNQVHIISWETLKPYWSPAIGIVHVDPFEITHIGCGPSIAGALWLKPSDGLPGRRSNDTHGSRQPRPDCIGLRVPVPGRARLCDCTPLGIMKIRRYPARATEQWTCDAPNIYTRTPVRPPNNNLRRSIIPSLYIAVLDEGAKRRKKENERVPRWVAGRWMAIGFPEI
ncbi:hypothetical protein B0H13DRAFT_1869857 [Mycena leptocephala]|nr:hypothetical protein B0H13DRAFT_1869857 [Mycena leptocephala]